MPIIANNFIINNNKVESESQPAATDLTPLIPLEQVSMVPKTKLDKVELGILIVDGKEKKISKQSQYILDMLTLDN